MFLILRQDIFSHKLTLLLLLAFGAFSAAAQETDKNTETQKAAAIKNQTSSGFAQDSQPVKILEKPRGILKIEYGNVCVRGTVRVRVQFLASGEIGNVAAVSRLPYGLTESAIEAAKKIRFELAKKDGVPITVNKTLEYSFGWHLDKGDFIVIRGGEDNATLSDNRKSAYKFRETTSLRLDLSEVYALDEFAAELNKIKDANGVIILFGKRGESLSYAREVQKRMSNGFGIDPARISANYGGGSEKRKMELWIVPESAKPPPLAPKVIYQTATHWDNFWVSCEYCDLQRTSALNALAEEIRDIPNSKVFIIFHPSKSDESIVRNRQNALKTAINAKKYLNKLKLENSRIVTLVGDYAESDYGELWIIPKGAKPPVKTTAFNRTASRKRF